MGLWVVDGNNVMGSRPDGWWNDRAGAAVRLAGQVARWCWTHDDDVLLVFDGKPVAAVAEQAGGNLRIRFAPRSGRNAADDLIVDLLTGDELDGEVVTTDPDTASVTVVTADRGLIARLPDGVQVVGPRRFLDRLADDS